MKLLLSFLCAVSFSGHAEIASASVAMAVATSAPSDFPVRVKSATGTVTAVFEGEKPPAELGVPLAFGTSKVSFEFRGDPVRYEFKPSGRIEFSDWAFELFSPDGKWVLLLQDRFGPYHVVSTRKLKDYLRGKVKPEKVERAPVGPAEAALVHSAARWLSNDEFEYRVGGESVETRRATVP